MKKQRGLTLIELMVTLAVFALLVGIGVPSLTSMSEGNRMVSQYNRLLGDLSVARSEAMKRGVNVVMCASNNSTATTPTCNTTQWELGWIYFADINNDGVFSSGTDTLLAINEAQRAGITIRTTDFDSAGVIRYQPNGAVRDTDGDGDSDGTFIICDGKSNTQKARAVNISTIGRLSKAKDTDADKTVNDVNGVNVTCP